MQRVLAMWYCSTMSVNTARYKMVTLYISRANAIRKPRLLGYVNSTKCVKYLWLLLFYSRNE